VGLCDLVSGATFLFIKNSNVETETRSRSTVYEVAVYGGDAVSSRHDDTGTGPNSYSSWRQVKLRSATCIQVWKGVCDGDINCNLGKYSTV